MRDPVFMEPGKPDREATIRTEIAGFMLVILLIAGFSLLVIGIARMHVVFGAVGISLLIGFLFLYVWFVRTTGSWKMSIVFRR